MTHDKIPFLLFNTATRRLEEVFPLDGKQIRLYTCGPTVYDFAHIGNFRTFVFEDVLRRAIRFFGMKLTQVMNLTDVDDKTIKGATSKSMSLNEFTRVYKEAFFEDRKTLNMEPVEYFPEATQYIPQMIEMCQKLIEKKVAYVGQDGSVYFAIREFPEYGKLSHLKLEELKEGSSERRAQDEYGKEHAADFVLWKAYDPARDGTICWPSPFGPGRPGWHLECSVMAQDLLGDQIDIHAGGVDLIFPHHENEIAQSESCTGQCFSRLWVHAEHLLVDNKKMSKSLGNFYTLRDLLQKGYSGKTIRLMLLQTHYRTQMNFTLQGLEGAKVALSRINDFASRLESYTPQGAAVKENVEGYLQEMLAQFSRTLAHDLNIPEALACLFDMIRHINALCDANTLSSEDAKKSLQVLERMDSVLGISSRAHVEVPDEIQKLVDERLRARAAKEWKRSDELRLHIQEKGYLVEDTPAGSRVKKI